MGGVPFHSGKIEYAPHIINHIVNIMKLFFTFIYVSNMFGVMGHLSMCLETKCVSMSYLPFNLHNVHHVNCNNVINSMYGLHSSISIVLYRFVWNACSTLFLCYYSEFVDVLVSICHSFPVFSLFSISRLFVAFHIPFNDK